jgi:hypothetical protein
MGILRSETMRHGTLILPAERARFFVELLGRKVQLQIEDMNETSMKRNYKKYIQRYASFCSQSNLCAGLKISSGPLDSSRTK